MIRPISTQFEAVRMAVRTGMYRLSLSGCKLLMVSIIFSTISLSSPQENRLYQTIFTILGSLSTVFLRVIWWVNESRWQINKGPTATVSSCKDSLTCMVSILIFQNYSIICSPQPLEKGLYSAHREQRRNFYCCFITTGLISSRGYCLDSALLTRSLNLSLNLSRRKSSLWQPVGAEQLRPPTRQILSSKGRMVLKRSKFQFCTSLNSYIQFMSNYFLPIRKLILVREPSYRVYRLLLESKGFEIGDWASIHNLSSYRHRETRSSSLGIMQ